MPKLWASVSRIPVPADMPVRLQTGRHAPSGSMPAPSAKGDAPFMSGVFAVPETPSIKNTDAFKQRPARPLKLR
jgi:hypothetical protein